MKDRFVEITGVRKQIQDLFHRLEEKKKGMKENYTSLVASNDNHFFGLDSFRFQVKLAENEYAFLHDQFILIENCLYCDYYKLYNHVYEYYIANLPHGVVKSVFPIYKDLEPTKVYDPEMVHKLYKDILNLIHKAYETLEHEHRKRESEKRLTSSGIHIGNYVHNRVFTDTLIKTNIHLFEEYLNTYFIYHMTFLVNLKERLGMFLDHVLRKQQTEQACNVDEVDDNFMSVAKETDTVMIETFHAVSRSETKEESPDPVTPPAEPATEPVTPPVVVPAAEPATEPVTPPVVVPAAEPASVPVVEPVAEPVVEPVAETVVEPVAETVVEPASEPVTQPASEPVAETASEPVVEPTSEPASEPEVEPVAEPASEPVVEPTSEPEVEPVAEPASEPEVEPTSEPASEPASEPVTQPASEPVAQPAAEPEAETKEDASEDIDPKEDVQRERTIEEVFNPIIEHILENTGVPNKKKKRPRKAK